MFISSGQKLTLYELNGEKNARQIRINEPVKNNSRAGFNVYSAVSKRKKGLLYELYDDTLLERTKSGKLKVADRSLKEDFIEYRNEFAQNFEIIKNCGLSFLPEISILYGNAVTEENVNKKSCSLYIWAPFEATSNVTDYLASGNSEKSIAFPEHKMYGIIRTAVSLAETMSKLNESGFRFESLSADDIFLKHEKRAKINQKSIRFICLDSIVPSDPELAFISDSDLLGRLLFRMISGEEYQSNWHGKLYEKISNSPLVLSSYRNGSVYVVNALYDIIRKTVANEYTGYSQIQSDLYALETSFLFEKANRDVGTIRPLDSLKSCSESKLVSTAVIQNMLDSRPLYICSAPQKSDLHIMTVGCGNFGQEFINQALQLGQMIGVNLKITAISDNPDADMNEYLINKPALKDFVSINEEKVADAYAELKFESVSADGASFSLINKEENQDLVADLVERYSDVSYIFVSLGNEILSRDIAEMFAELTSCFENGCCVNYACYSDSFRHEKAYPVCINRRSIKNISKDLRDMALKVHLSWSKITDKDLNTIRTEFENDPYSFNSSIANAISIRYKLHSFGIDYDYGDKKSLSDAADKFSSTVLLNEDKTNYNKLVWLEHNRWVLEKAVSGWTALPSDDFEKIISKHSAKDDVNRKHPCMVKSKPVVFDNIWEKETGVLDPLDKVSVRFNKCLKKAADISKQNWPEHEDTLALIGKRINKHHVNGNKKANAQYAYNRYIVAIKNILGESVDYAKKYASYRKSLLSSCESLGGETFGNEISFLLKYVDNALFPIVEHAKKTDYKKIDAFLVSKIPYILTAPLSPSIAMSFSAKNGNEEALNNIAAALALSTNNIYYFFYYDSNCNYNYLARKIKTVVNYLEEKNICCETDFFIAVDPCCTAFTEAIKESLRSIPKITYKVQNCHDEEDAHRKFKTHLSDKKIDFFNRSVNAYKNNFLNDSLYRTLGYPCFDFSLEKKRFYGDQECSYLNYFDTSDMHITTEDLLLLSNAKDSAFNFPELFDSAKDLWEKVCINSNNFAQCIGGWNGFCKLISNYINKNNALATIKSNNSSKISNENDDKIISEKFILPSLCFATAKKITAALENEKFAIRTKVQNRTSGTCEITVNAKEAVIKALREVFNGSPDILSNAKLIEAGFADGGDNNAEQGGKSFVISNNSLCINDLDISEPGNSVKVIKTEYQNILKKLEAQKFINNLKIDEEKKQASFVFSSYGIKNVLKKEGELLENYIFYEAARTGYFDDVVSGFEFTYEPDSSEKLVKNEIDCILTKGTATIIVEAKARATIDQNTIHKLCNVADNIGVNAKKVLVITDHGWQSNDLQFARGDKYEVIIISGKEEISKIGESLKKIADGKYIPKSYL